MLVTAVALQSSAMPAGSIVINATRGELLDEAALLAALGSGHLAGAALDVYTTDPLDPTSPLRSEDRILLSPHSASSTSEAIQRIRQYALANLHHGLQGEPLDHVQNTAGLVPTGRA